MKGREVEEKLRDKVDPVVISVLREMCEDFRVQQEEIQSLAQLIDKTIDLTMQLGVTIEGTQGAVDKIRKIRNIE